MLVGWALWWAKDYPARSGASAGVGTGRKVMREPAESRGRHFSSALIAWLQQSTVLGPRDASWCRGMSSCPGISEPQPGVTFQKKLWQDLAKLEDASELPGGIDVSRLREQLLQEQRKRLPGGEGKRRLR